MERKTSSRNSKVSFKSPSLCLFVNWFNLSLSLSLSLSLDACVHHDRFVCLSFFLYIIWSTSILWVQRTNENTPLAHLSPISPPSILHSYVDVLGHLHVHTHTLDITLPYSHQILTHMIPEAMLLTYFIVESLLYSDWLKLVTWLATFNQSALFQRRIELHWYFFQTHWLFMAWINIIIQHTLPTNQNHPYTSLTFPLSLTPPHHQCSSYFHCRMRCWPTVSVTRWLDYLFNIWLFKTKKTSRKAKKFA